MKRARSARCIIKTALRPDVKVDLGRIYDRFGERMFHYLSVKLGSAQDAEDVLQEVFYRLLKNPLRLRLVRDQAAYIFRTARNEALRFLGGKIRDRRISSRALEFQDVIRASLSGAGRDEEDKAARALAGIPEEQREVIILKIFEELTFKEIASVCGLSINTAASRYRYGLEKLREILEESR
jgi:RNA polymerase sigma-70 factor (ECF subfamily)